MVKSDLGISCSSSQKGCVDVSGCPSDKSVDFCIKRNDTIPHFKIALEDCDGIVGLEDDKYALQINIWVKTKLKNDISDSDTQISFADNIGFYQIFENDIILMDRPRNPEKMRVVGFDEENKTITVERGYNATIAQSWKKGSVLRVFRLIDGDAEIESVYEDLQKEDGTTSNELTDTFLVFRWTNQTTSLAGCYWLEFKLIELNEELTEILSVRRFPSTEEGFLIKVLDSST
jgi:hypothetical protein